MIEDVESEGAEEKIRFDAVKEQEVDDKYKDEDEREDNPAQSSAGIQLFTFTPLPR